jgi:hypothetical protein
MLRFGVTTFPTDYGLSVANLARAVEERGRLFEPRRIFGPGFWIGFGHDQRRELSFAMVKVSGLTSYSASA